jgi:hypothetical protein
MPILVAGSGLKRLDPGSFPTESGFETLVLDFFFSVEMFSFQLSAGTNGNGHINGDSNGHNSGNNVETSGNGLVGEEEEELKITADTRKKTSSLLTYSGVIITTLLLFLRDLLVLYSIRKKRQLFLEL